MVFIGAFFLMNLTLAIIKVLIKYYIIYNTINLLKKF